MKSTLEFLRDEIYLPGYLAVGNLDYSGNTVYFDFTPVEPPVARIPIGYLTPRGVHIGISQSSICFVEERLLEQFGVGLREFRDTASQGMLKLVEFNQRFRKEVGLDGKLQGKLVLTKSRHGKLPVIKMDFDIGNRAVSGEITGVVAPRPVPQTNADILR